MFIVRSRKSVVWGLIFAVVGLTLGAAVKFSPYVKTFGYGEKDRIAVVVDAGHGQPDGGTVGAGGTVEQEINLAIAQKLCEVLEGKGIRTVMTRTSEEGLQGEHAGSVREMKREDMNKRTEIMKTSKADLFVSIHMNSFDSPKISGLRLFYDKKHPEMKELAEIMQQKMGGVTGAQMKAVKAADERLFLMKNPPLPSILVECGFLSNPEEEQKLNDAEYQAKLAWAIADSIEKYFAAGE